MAVDLHDILFGIGVGRFHDGNQNFINDLAVKVCNFTIRKCMCRFFCQFLFADENFVRDLDTAGTCHSYDTDAANTHRRGNRRNHIIQHIFSFHIYNPLVKDLFSYLF